MKLYAYTEEDYAEMYVTLDRMAYQIVKLQENFDNPENVYSLSRELGEAFYVLNNLLISK